MRILAYITGTADQALLLRNEYLAAENRILKAQFKSRLLLTDVESASQAGSDRAAYLLADVGRMPLSLDGAVSG